jgi:hypothetical protein
MIKNLWFILSCMFLLHASDDSVKDADTETANQSDDESNDNDSNSNGEDQKQDKNSEKNTSKKEAGLKEDQEDSEKSDAKNEDTDEDEDDEIVVSKKDKNNKKASSAILKILDITNKNPEKKTSLNDINTIFQKYYFQKNKERFDMILDEKDDVCEKIIDKCLKDLNFSCPKWPDTQQIKKCQGIMLLGSTVAVMTQRIGFLKLLIQAHPDLKKVKIYLLTGRRTLTSEEKQSVSVDDEAEAFQEIFQNLCPDLDFILVYSSNTGMKRATTESTAKEWLQLSPAKGTYLSISSEPFIAHQTMVFKNCLGEGYNIIGTGPGILPELYQHINVKRKAAILMDALAKTIYEMTKWYNKTQQTTDKTQD